MPPPGPQSTQRVVHPARQSIRLRGYDYSRPGAYLVTLCVHERAHLFGFVKGGTVQLNDLGRVVEEEWCRSAQLRPGVTLDHFVIMPNHLHGILILGGDSRESPPQPAAFGKPTSGSLSTVVGQFKASATSRINTIRGSPGARVWQRNFFETIIRNERALQEMRRYVAQNPANWDVDPEA